jgi:hypothetical protein
MEAGRFLNNFKFNLVLFLIALLEIWQKQKMKLKRKIVPSFGEQQIIGVPNKTNDYFGIQINFNGISLFAFLIYF